MKCLNCVSGVLCVSRVSECDVAQCGVLVFILFMNVVFIFVLLFIVLTKSYNLLIVYMLYRVATAAERQRLPLKHADEDRAVEVSCLYVYFVCLCRVYMRVHLLS